MTTYLSTNFTLEEFCDSQTAARQGIDNCPDKLTLESLKRTAYGLEEVRKELGDKPILISSGYRSPELNRAVGGTERSQHTLGHAVDFTCPAFGTPREIVRRLIDSAIQYDQCILEFFDPVKKTGWCHISFSARNRRVALVIDKSGAREFA